MTSLGLISFNNPATYQFFIPDVVPDTAREFLLYASVICGGTVRDLSADIIFYVENGSTRYEKFLHMYGWDQLAYNTNSDNMWFPMPSNRLVHMELPIAFPGSCWAQLFTIGYR